MTRKCVAAAEGSSNCSKHCVRPFRVCKSKSKLVSSWDYTEYQQRNAGVLFETSIALVTKGFFKDVARLVQFEPEASDELVEVLFFNYIMSMCMN